MSGCPARGGPLGSPPPLSILQPARGYRYSVDSVLLAAFAAPHAGTSVLDLGTGCGVLLLLLSRLAPVVRRGTGIELQEELAAFAQRNLERNSLAGRFEVHCADFRNDIAALSGSAFDLVICNPPFGKVGGGRHSPDAARQVARHEVACTLADVFRAAARFLGPRGRFALVAPVERLPELFALAEAFGLARRAVRLVHPFPHRPANRVLFLAGRRRVPRLQVLPPLCLYTGKGRYHPEVELLFRHLGKKVKQSHGVVVNNSV